MMDRSGMDISYPFDYQLGECIGKGAFGTVYRGFDMQKGASFAVKQIELSHLNKFTVDSISEISLLKKLNHPNIVKYFGLHKTATHYNILIEYCENGSLQSIYKRFGKFPENLTGVYISQVLDGLVYLHEQGVIHRDIKGANILATKEGMVKLADFGVATIANDDNSVVGSPYWMAPEVIELVGAKPVSDIWSVGCTVIELMEGNPPYHFLEQMPALFRIVQDDHPPLPQSVSPVVNDFLLQCFQKDYNLRVTAQKLVKHPWIQNAKLKGRDEMATPMKNFNEDVKLLQEWNEAIKVDTSPQNTTVGGLRPRPSPKYTQTPTLNEDKEFDDGSPTVRMLDLASATKAIRITPLSAIQPEEVEDNWDADFDISGSDINIDKIRKAEPLEFNGNKSKGLKLSQSPNMELSKSPNNHLISHLTKLEMEMNGRMEGVGLPLLPNKDNLISKDPLQRYVEREDDDDYSDLFRTVNITNNPIVNQLFNHGQNNINNINNNNNDNNNINNINNNNNDDDDINLNESNNNLGLVQHNQVNVDQFYEEEDDDPFQSLEEGLEQTDLQKNIIRNKNARIAAEIKQLIKLLHANQDDTTLLETCERLEILLLENPNMKFKFISSHGILPILEVLELSDFEPVLVRLLRIVNLIVHNNVEIQENLCLVGGIPVIISLASKRYPISIRLEVAYFIRQLCHTSTFTLQMFISCRGLKILVDFIEEEYSLQKELIYIAINGIASIFELQTPTPKHDFCRLFTKSGLLEPLADVLSHTIKDEDPVSSKYLSKVVHLFLIFSQADPYVKEVMGTSYHIVSCLLHEVRRLPLELFVIILKCVRNLSMNPNTLETLERAKAIEILAQFLIPRNMFGPSEISTHVLSTMYNLCRINKRRQELAAQAGIIPHLQQISTMNSPLRQFALPILLDMAHAGKVCRRLLARSKGLQFFLALLSDPNWITNSLEAILVWLQGEPREVEMVLVESSNLSILVQSFVYARHNATLEGLIAPLPMIIKLSPKLAHALSLKPKFINKLLERLVSYPKALVRLSLLKILKCLLDQSNSNDQRYLNHHQSRMLSGKYDIRSIVDTLSKTDPAVLVREMAKELVSKIDRGNN